MLIDLQMNPDVLMEAAGKMREWQEKIKHGVENLEPFEHVSMGGVLLFAAGVLETAAGLLRKSELEQEADIEKVIETVSVCAGVPREYILPSAEVVKSIIDRLNAKAKEDE